MGIRVAGLQNIVKLLFISSTLIANHIHVSKNTPGRADELLYHANACINKARPIGRLHLCMANKYIDTAINLKVT